MFTSLSFLNFQDCKKEFFFLFIYVRDKRVFPTGDSPPTSVKVFHANFGFLQANFIEIALWHGSSFVNLLHIFRTTFSKCTSGGLLLKETY